MFRAMFRILNVNLLYRCTHKLTHRKGNEIFLTSGHVFFFFMAGTSDCNSGIEYRGTLICYDTNLGTRIYDTDTELYIIADFFFKNSRAPFFRGIPSALYFMSFSSYEYTKIL